MSVESSPPARFYSRLHRAGIEGPNQRQTNYVSRGRPVSPLKSIRWFGVSAGAIKSCFQTGPFSAIIRVDKGEEKVKTQPLRISERTKAGMARVRASGKQIGRAATQGMRPRPRQATPRARHDLTAPSPKSSGCPMSWFWKAAEPDSARPRDLFGRTCPGRYILGVAQCNWTLYRQK